MKTHQLFTICLISILLPLNSFSQKQSKNPFVGCKDSIGRSFMGKYIAKKELSRFKKNTNSRLLEGKILIKSKEALISITEPILFDIYGKRNIVAQRPYEAYLFGDYWIMMGTLPNGIHGGTFAIAINQKTCTVIGISHGK